MLGRGWGDGKIHTRPCFKSKRRSRYSALCLSPVNGCCWWGCDQSLSDQSCSFSHAHPRRVTTSVQVFGLSLSLHHPSLSSPWQRFGVWQTSHFSFPHGFYTWFGCLPHLQSLVSAWTEMWFYMTGNYLLPRSVPTFSLSICHKANLVLLCAHSLPYSLVN